MYRFVIHVVGQCTVCFMVECLPFRLTVYHSDQGCIIANDMQILNPNDSLACSH